MSDLRNDWDLFALRLATAPSVCVLSDFDGTLVPLKDTPDQVVLPAAVRKLLQSLGRPGRSIAGVVSGRALDDLVARVGLEGLWYVGNHGFELRAPDGTTTRHYDGEDVRCMNRVRDELAAETVGVPGVLLEHKGPIVALHYRRVEPSRVREVEEAFTRVMKRHREQVTMAHGRQHVEARVRGARNKGTAVRGIRKHLPEGSLVVYFGDDLTDRDVFRELQAAGVSVEVGETDSALAHYTLPDPDAVHEVLRRIAGALSVTG